MDYSYIKSLHEIIPDVPADSIISRTVNSTDQSKSILFAFAPGQELSEHTAAKNAVLYFLQGEADLTLGNDRMTAESGTWVQMPPHLPHSITAKTEVIMLLMMFN
jgi:quercetin dioxygenase-like cupin family protein